LWDFDSFDSGAHAKIPDNLFACLKVLSLILSHWVLPETEASRE
jgi:hypothetical protein